jgi:tripartite-type tricarboxylate transporter receptor subunit TctC
VRSRLVAQRLERALKQPIVVDNRPGASGTIGMQAVARSAPDGHTIAFGRAGRGAEPDAQRALRSGERLRAGRFHE